MSSHREHVCAALEVEDLVVTDEFGVPRVKNVNLSVRAGEIVGIAGVAGNGQSQLLEAISGMRAPLLGQVRIKGEPINFRGDNNLGFSDYDNGFTPAGHAQTAVDNINPGCIVSDDWRTPLGELTEPLLAIGVQCRHDLAHREAEGVVRSGIR